MYRRRHRHGPDPRRIVFIVSGCVILALLIVSALAPRSQSRATGAPSVDRSLRAFRAGTGTFALPAAGSGPADFTAAEARARQAGAALAFTMYVEQEPLETRAWRDQLMVGRFPISRPPQIDFARELAVLVWPVRGVAPESLFRAHGLAVESVQLQHIALELRVTADLGGAPPATPAVPPSNTSVVAPYGLFTIPRSQWPLPSPAPTEPPLIVTLAQ